MALQLMQSFVGAAGEALGLGDPLTTNVGSKINKATDENLLMEDWSLNMEICDIVNSTEEGPTNAARAIKKRLQNTVGRSHKGTLLTLTVLETCVKNCGKRFHFLVCQKEFASDLIDSVISSNMEISPAIQDKVLSMVQSWAHAFSPDQDLRGVAEVYIDLKKKGVDFPTPSDEDLLLVQTENQEKVYRPPSSASSNCLNSNTSSKQQQTTLSLKHKTSLGSIGSDVALSVAKGKKLQASKLPASGRLTEGQARKLERDLEIAQRNLDVFSDLLSEVKSGQEHPEDKVLLRQVSETCKEMQARILKLIGVVQHRELTERLLDINDNMNNHLLRYERYMNNKEPENNKSKKDPESFSPDEVLLMVPPISCNKHEFSTITEKDHPSLEKASKETDFQEIEAWMMEHEKEIQDKGNFEGNHFEDATTDEFNKFLLKRVEVAKEE